MRGILVDWLVEVAEEYKLVPDTLFLSVAYIDRCLTSMPVRLIRARIPARCSLYAARLPPRHNTFPRGPLSVRSSESDPAARRSSAPDAVAVSYPLCRCRRC